MQLQEHIYSVTPDASLLIGKRNLGHVSNYYTGEVIDDDEVAAIQDAAEKNDINVLNTRYVGLAKRIPISDLSKGPQELPDKVYPSGCLRRRSTIC